MRRSCMAALVAALVACGGHPDGHSDDARVCKQLHTLCPGAHPDPCPSRDDWRELTDDLGAATVTRFRQCVLAADTCPALTACARDLGLDAMRALAEDDDLRALGGQPPAATGDAGLGPDADGGHDRPAVRFDSVVVRIDGAPGGYRVAAIVDLTVTAAMPEVVAPDVTVVAACGTATDEDDHAFFSNLDGAQAGDRRTDLVTLFAVDKLTEAPTQCELVLGLTAGPTPPTRFCYRAGTTVAGACPP